MCKQNIAFEKRRDERSQENGDRIKGRGEMGFLIVGKKEMESVMSVNITNKSNKIT